MVQEMRILVLGATGMAGHTITLYLIEKGYDVTAFSRSTFPYCENINGDILDFDFVKGIIRNNNFDAIINAVGILNQDAENNKSTAILINSYLPHFLVEITKDTNTKIIHMSTDCVFSGKTGNYAENSYKDGESFYDRTKALGELDNEKDLTFRNSIIGPDMHFNGIGLFNWFMKQNTNIYGYTRAIWTGVTTLTLAKAIEIALKENITGIYNLVNNQKISKYELLKILNKYMRNNKIDIIPNNINEIDKSLINNRKDLSFIVPSYETMVKEMSEWISYHKDIYLHYFIER